MTINELPFVMIRCLFLTILFETSFAYFFKYRGKDLLIVALSNIVTNPLVVSISVYFNYYHGISGRNISLLILEPLAFLIEALIYKNFIYNKKMNYFTLSLVLNMLSFLIGELINFL